MFRHTNQFNWKRKEEILFRPLLNTMTRIIIIFEFTLKTIRNSFSMRLFNNIFFICWTNFTLNVYAWVEVTIGITMRSGSGSRQIKKWNEQTKRVTWIYWYGRELAKLKKSKETKRRERERTRKEKLEKNRICISLYRHMGHLPGVPSIDSILPFVHWSNKICCCFLYSVKEEKKTK